MIARLIVTLELDDDATLSAVENAATHAEIELERHKEIRRVHVSRLEIERKELRHGTR